MPHSPGANSCRITHVVLLTPAHLRTLAMMSLREESRRQGDLDSGRKRPTCNALPAVLPGLHNPQVSVLPPLLGFVVRVLYVAAYDTSVKSYVHAAALGICQLKGP